MAKRKTEDQSELLELLRQKVDLRTGWGKEAWAAIEGYVERNDTSKLSLLKGLVIEFPEKALLDILNVDPVDYQRNVKAKCVCGQGLSREAYRMRIRGISRKCGVESQIDGKIKDRVKVSRISRSSKVEFLLGKDCFAHFPELLADFGYDDMQKTVKESKKKKQEELEEMADDISPELEKALRKQKIDPEQFRKISELMKDSEVFTKESFLYGLDPGKKNSFANWFREGIKDESIDNEEIADIYHKLENASHLLSTEELAALTTYSYEHRKFETRAVIGGARDDLFYLAELGEINLDKRYVRPRTRFRSRKGLEKVTIREKLEQSHMTFLEALGIKIHFPGIEDARIDYNRETADKYGIGRSWDYILKEIKPVFEEIKGELAEEYKEFGKIVHEHVLTKKEYLAAKDFLNRSRMGRGTERDNYLKMFSIIQFREIAPVIAAVGRKIRYARRKYEETGDEWLKQDLMKQEYALKEDMEERFEELTGIEEEQDKVIGMIVYSGFVKSKNFLKFQKEHGQAIREMHENGLLAKKYFRKTGKSRECALKRQYDNLRFEGVKEIDEETSGKLGEIVEALELPFFEYKGDVSAEEIGSLRYTSRDGVQTINRLYSDVQRIKKQIGLEEANPEEFEENKKMLENSGRVLYLDEGEFAALASEKVYDIKSMKARDDPCYRTGRKKKEYEVSAYNIKEMEEAAKNIKEGTEADREFLRKLDSLNYDSLKAIGSDKYCSLIYLKQGRYDKVIVSEALKKRVGELYEKVLGLGS